MKKRFLSGILALTMIVGLALSAFPALIVNAETEPVATYNMAEEMRKVLNELSLSSGGSINANTNKGDYRFGNFFVANTIINPSGATPRTYDKLHTISKTASEYQLITANSYNNPYIAVGYNGANYEGVDLAVTYYNVQAGYTFVAPKTGVYKLTPKTAYNGKNGSIWNNFEVDATLKIDINGTALNISNETDPTAFTIASGAVADVPALDEIELNAGDLLTFNVTFPRSNWNYDHFYMNFDIDLMVDLTPPPPLASYNFADSMREKLSALNIAAGSSVSDSTAFVDYDFGPFNFQEVAVNSHNLTSGAVTAYRYTSVKTIKNNSGEYQITPAGTSWNTPYVGTNSTDGGLVFYSKVWSNAYEYVYKFTFTAPKSGVYNIVPKSAYSGKLSLYNTATRDAYFSVVIDGEVQNISTETDKTVLTIPKSGGSVAIPDMGNIELNEGEVIEFIFKTQVDGTKNEGAGGRIYTNFDIDMVDTSLNLSGSRYSYNLGTELRNVLSSTAKLESTNLTANPFGPYTLSAFRLNSDGSDYLDSKGNRVSWSTLASGNVLTEGGDYRVDIRTDYDQSKLAVGTDTSKYSGYALYKKNYFPMELVATFTAPETGKYNFAPKSAYNGMQESVYNTYSGNVEVVIKVNGVEQIMTGNSTKLVVRPGQSAHLPTLKGIELNAGETIEVYLKVITPSIGWGTSYAYINYDIEIVDTDNQELWFAGLNLSDASAYAGADATKVELKLSKLTEAASGMFAVVNYEPNVFEFDRAESAAAGVDVVAIASNGILNIVASSDTNLIGNTPIATLYFKVKSGISPADYTINPKSLQLIRVSDTDASKIEEMVVGKLVTRDSTVTVKSCDHSWTATGTPTEATCLENSKTQEICGICSSTRTVDIENTKTGHLMTHNAYKAPSCTVDGNEEHYFCSRCEKTFKDDGIYTEAEFNAVIPASHQMAYTPIAGGKHQMSCQADGCEEGSGSAAEDCTLEYTHIDATETHKVTCDKCKRDETASCSGSNWVPVKAPTWKESGEKKGECSLCLGECVETIPAGTVKSVSVKDGSTYKKLYMVGDQFDYSSMIFVISYNETGLGYEDVEVKASDLLSTEIAVAAFDSSTAGTVDATLTVLGKTVTVTGIVVTDRTAGDANEDGHVTVADAQLIFWHIANPLDSNYNVNEANSDVNGDGHVTVADAQLIFWHIANPGNEDYKPQ